MEQQSTPAARVLSPADAAILAAPAGKAAFARLAAYLPLVRLQIPGLRPVLPSYVIIALDALLAAVDQWQKDLHV